MENTKGKLLWAVIASMATLNISCSDKYDTSSMDFDDYTQLALDMWMADNVPDAIRYDDGYYIDSYETNGTGKLTSEEDCWVRYNITSRSLDGDICNTRDEFLAYQMGTFTYYTHYEPTITYLYQDDPWFDEDAIYLAMLDEEVGLREGDKFTLYSPTHLTGSLANGSGGYAGQSTLDTYAPMVSEIEITDVFAIGNDWEIELIENFANVLNPSNGWTWVDGWTWVYEDDYEDYESYVYDDDYNVYDDQSWIYIDLSYKPGTTKYTYENPYSYSILSDTGDVSGFDVSGFDNLNNQIDELLIDMFGEGVDDGDLLSTTNYGNVWYVVRTLDGFVIDTNVPTVAALVHNEYYDWDSDYDYNDEIYYNADYSSDDYITAWKYAIPLIKYGQWATILTASPDAYWYTGQSSSSSDSSSPEIAPYTPLLFTIYIEEEDD